MCCLASSRHGAISDTGLSYFTNSTLCSAMLLHAGTPIPPTPPAPKHTQLWSDVLCRIILVFYACVLTQLGHIWSMCSNTCSVFHNPVSMSSNPIPEPDPCRHIPPSRQNPTHFNLHPHKFMALPIILLFEHINPNPCRDYHPINTACHAVTVFLFTRLSVALLWNASHPLAWGPSFRIEI